MTEELALHLAKNKKRDIIPAKELDKPKSDASLIAMSNLGI